MGRMCKFKDEMRLLAFAALMVAMSILVLRFSETPPVFVTADKALVRALVDSRLQVVLPHIVHPHQAAYLVELAETGQRPIRGLSRILWSVRHDRAQHVREFYTDKVLAEYEPGLVKDLDSLVSEVIDEIGRRERSFGPIEDDIVDGTIRSLKVFRALDRFDSNFHENMDKALERLHEVD